MKGFDTAESTLGNAHFIAGKFKDEEGNLQPVVAGLYMRPDRTTLAEIEGLFSVQDAAGNGIFYILPFHEKGNPTSPAYFTDDQAKFDGEFILTQMAHFNFPTQLPINVTADYDSKISEIDSYLRILHGILYPENRYLGLYGNWTCIQHFKALVADDGHNMIHSGVVTQSTGFKPYPTEDELANVVDAWQGPSMTLCGMDCDEENVNNLSILWRP